MPSQPIVEQIAENIKTVVGSIATSSPFTISYSCVRPVQNWPTAATGQVILIQEGKPIATGLKEVPTGWREWLWPFTLVAQVLQSEAVATPIDELRNAMFADIHNAVLVDTTRGGLAIDTFVEEPEFYASPQGYWATEIVISVQFRTLYLDAYNQ